MNILSTVHADDLSLFMAYDDVRGRMSRDEYRQLQPSLTLGPFADYWQSTLRPSLAGGHLQAAARGEVVYPKNINLFIGLSCMFNCSFCGRNANAAHKYSETTYQTFARIIEEDDGCDPYRFGVAGGQEPLTNPRCNDIFALLAKKGYRSRCVTNAFMLTPKFLRRNESMLELDTIRVSLYGVDKNSTKLVTGNAKAYGRVQENLAHLNRLESRPRLGLNYVLLPENYRQLPTLLTYIDAIGGVEFVSLREDFTFEQEVDDRSVLAEELRKFENGCRERGVTVDFGYALAALVAGYGAPRLVRAEARRINPTQAPQVKVAIDPDGNVFSHQEAAFIGRPGAERHILGNVADSSLIDELAKRCVVPPRDGDVAYMDAFNQVIELFSYKLRKDFEDGIDLDWNW